MVLAGLGSGNSNTTNTIDKQGYKQITDTQLSNNQLISTVQKIVSKTISETLVNNSADIQNIIKLNNSINFVGGEDCPPMQGSINISHIKQSIKVDSTVNNKLISKTVSDITTKVNTEIKNSISNITEGTTTSENKARITSAYQGIADSLMGGIVNAVPDVAPLLAAVNNNTKVKQVETELINKYKLNNDFKLSNSTDINNEASSIVTIEDITKILGQITAANNLGASGFCPTFIDISNISQSISIKSLTENKTVTNISNKISTNYINKIDRVISNMNQSKLSTVNDTSIGDLGDAVAGMIGGGNGLGKKYVKATVEKPVETVQPGVTKPVSTAKKGGSGVLIIIILILLILAVLFYFFVLPKIL